VPFAAGFERPAAMLAAMTWAMTWAVTWVVAWVASSGVARALEPAGTVGALAWGGPFQTLATVGVLAGILVVLARFAVSRRVPIDGDSGCRLVPVFARAQLVDARVPASNDPDAPGAVRPRAPGRPSR